MTEKKNIHQRIHAIMKDVQYIKKEPKGGLQYSYVSHDAVTKKIRDAAVMHGVLIVSDLVESSLEHFDAMSWDSKAQRQVEKTTYLAQVKMDITYINIDDPEDQFISKGWLGIGIDTQDKAAGKAESYAFKMGLLKGFMLETGDDVESDQTTEYERSYYKSPFKDRDDRKEWLASTEADIATCGTSQEWLDAGKKMAPNMLIMKTDEKDKLTNDSDRDWYDVIKKVYDEKKAEVQND